MCGSLVAKPFPISMGQTTLSCDSTHYKQITHTHTHTGPSSVLPTWYLSSWGSQWSSSRLHDHCQETDLHLLPDVQADANWSQP